MQVVYEDNDIEDLAKDEAVKIVQDLPVPQAQAMLCMRHAMHQMQYPLYRQHHKAAITQSVLQYRNDMQNGYQNASPDVAPAHSTRASAAPRQAPYSACSVTSSMTGSSAEEEVATVAESCEEAGDDFLQEMEDEEVVAITSKAIHVAKKAKREREVIDLD